MSVQLTTAEQLFTKQQQKHAGTYQKRYPTPKDREGAMK